MYEIYLCHNKCCELKIKPYIHKNFQKKSNKKSGIFIYDPIEMKFLLVQSNGNLWGPPKGSINENESTINCAIREVYEETGILINKKDFIRVIYINNNSTYYYVEKRTVNINVQNNPLNNDANGIGWINMKCLEECIKNGNMNITYHCRILLKKLFNKDLPYSNFILVRKNRNKI